MTKASLDWYSPLYACCICNRLIISLQHAQCRLWRSDKRDLSLNYWICSVILRGSIKTHLYFGNLVPIKDWFMKAMYVHSDLLPYTICFLFSKGTRQNSHVSNEYRCSTIHIYSVWYDWWRFVKWAMNWNVKIAAISNILGNICWN